MELLVIAWLILLNGALTMSEPAAVSFEKSGSKSRRKKRQAGRGRFEAA